MAPAPPKNSSLWRLFITLPLLEYDHEYFTPPQTIYLIITYNNINFVCTSSLLGVQLIATLLTGD